jgi:hypothetical protein
MVGEATVSAVAVSEQVRPASTAGLRPTRSETPPSRSSAGSSPATYIANTTAVMPVP